MIGGHIPHLLRSRTPPIRSGNPTFEHLRLELRRGCLALAVLAELRTERYGYVLRQTMADRGIDIEAGTLYPLLRRLEAQGLLHSEWRNAGKRRKRFYRLTTDGWRVLDQLQIEWNWIALSLDGILGRPRIGLSRTTQ